MPIDRIGRRVVERTDLERYDGLAKRWPKLAALQDEAATLAAQANAAAEEVMRLENGADDAKSKDDNLYAVAIRAKEEDPGTPHQDEHARELREARRRRDGLAKAADSAEAELNAYRAAHAAELQRDMMAGLRRKAGQLTEHAHKAAALFAQIEDGRREAARIAPPQAPPESNAPARPTTIISRLTPTQSAGMDRGTIEQALAYLSTLEAEFSGPEETDEAGAA